MKTIITVSKIKSKVLYLAISFVVWLGTRGK